ncbi:hypothetical protein [Acetobacter sp. DsW_063]|uniref:hypothetical protein n=1 Tax=Acetobacter sp. DsW_063 TaxID=1514894 RepID=UPI000A3D0AE9|nr:hypothetical protein [Acetobacter sp. DsW_063]OUJ14713.1 hypothetical protein HK28_11850 [Acetobacter sp. DsW_063]
MTSLRRIGAIIAALGTPLTLPTVVMAQATDPALGPRTEVTATIRLPTSSLIFEGEGLQALDDSGHFAIGVHLPQKGLRAEECDTPFLTIGMGTINKLPGEWDDNDRAAIQRSAKAYQALTHPTSKTVTIKLRNFSEYLGVSRFDVDAKLCILSIDDTDDAVTPALK